MKETRENKYKSLNDNNNKNNFITEDKKGEDKQVEEIVVKRKRPFLRNILVIIIIFMISFITYSLAIEPKMIIVHEYGIKGNIPESFDGFKIMQLSDIHYGTSINLKGLKKLVNKINENKPDIIVFTGDLIDKEIKINNNIKEEIIKILSGINNSLGMYAINGDEDNELSKEILTTLNFNILDNAQKLIYYENTKPIKLVGLGKEIDEELFDNKDDLYTIVLLHQPDDIENIINYNVNLVLAGHNLGGIINIGKPLFNKKGATKYNELYYHIKDFDYYISNGLGSSKVNIRFNNIPSISLFRLYIK